MALSKVIRRRGATIIVEAHGEFLFTPTSDVVQWQRRFSRAITRHTQAAAPSNKRPRWGHYGDPLKSTFSSTTVKPSPQTLSSHSAVRSSAPHAIYVDQGTGIHAGNGPYKAKILPPWQRGSASLYEHTWRPGGPGGWKVAPVMIKGQKGQFFFRQGLEAGFREMRVASYPGGAPTAAIDAALNLTDNFFGYAPLDTSEGSAFDVQLEEWRAWRDEAWGNGEGLGRGGGIGSRAHQRYVRQAAQQRRTRPRVSTPKPKTTNPKSTTKPQPKPTKPQYTEAQARALVVRDLKARGIPASKVRSINIRADGTYTYEFRRAGGIWETRSGKWRRD